MTQDLAETILRDVPIRGRIYTGGRINTGGNCLDELVFKKDVEAALTAAMDPAIAERAVEVLSRLRKADEYEPLGHDGWEAADLITALLSQNAALRADKEALHLALGEASKTIVEIKAERDALRAEVEWWKQDDREAWDKCEERRIAQEAAEAQIAALTARVEELTGALAFYAEDGWKDKPLDPPTPEEVEMFGGNILDFPMPEVFFDRGERARAALSTTEERK